MNCAKGRGYIQYDVIDNFINNPINRKNATYEQVYLSHTKIEGKKLNS